ncbi:unnamed protein product [Tuber aestivum]|uniref:Uncharacterized protein n=1 Tax=Tuber aestivum TaxID=59557 RepID=A0A292Q4F6_9PEZI|nr:unnamed protein product [Tuber aestivum]
MWLRSYEEPAGSAIGETPSKSNEIFSNPENKGAPISVGSKVSAKCTALLKKRQGGQFGRYKVKGEAEQRIRRGNGKGTVKTLSPDYQFHPTSPAKEDGVAQASVPAVLSPKLISFAHGDHPMHGGSHPLKRRLPVS